MKTLRKAFFKNASTNLVQLAASSIVGILLPPLLAHRLSRETYSAWTLIVQLSMYVTYFDLGLQAAVGYFVAFTEEQHDFTRRDRVVSSAILLLLILSGIGLALMVIITWKLPRLFHSIPGPLIHASQLSLLIVGISVALMLPTNALAAIFIGEQRNEIPAGISIVGRITSAIVIAFFVFRQAGLVWMSAALALSNLMTSVLQLLAWRRLAGYVSIRMSNISRDVVLQLFRFCYGLTVWTVSGLLISGLDTTVVGVVQFSHVAYYGVAATVSMFLIQFQSAVMRALMPTASVLNGRNDRDGLGNLLITTTRYGLILLYSIGLPMIFFARPILRLWIGNSFATETAPILQVLVIANIIRLVSLPYATLVVGTNQHNQIAIIGIIEGIVNLAASMVLGRHFGALGVAFGTLVGAIVSVGANIVYGMHITTQITYAVRPFVFNGIVRPTLCFMPWVFFSIIFSSYNYRVSFQLVVLHVFAIAFTAVLCWNFGFAVKERGQVATFFKNFRSRLLI